MRNEIFWVAGIGITIGLIVAFGVFRINSSLSQKNSEQKATPTPKAGVSEFKIALSKPEDDDVITENSVTVTGITKENVWVEISGESKDYLTESDNEGNFSQDVDLTPGVNQIRINAYDKGGNLSTSKVLVVYSSSFQVSAATNTTVSTNASSDSDIRAKVAQKVKEAMNNPKAYIGVVTDIADSTIQIKTADAQIEQISTSGDSITVINSKGTTNKTVKLTDIAIGDFIVAMGYVNGNSVLLAQRILITDPIEEPKIAVSMGKVTDKTTKSVTVTGLIDQTPTVVTPAKNTSINVKFASISEGDSVIYVIDSSGTTPVARSIFVVESP